MILSPPKVWARNIQLCAHEHAYVTHTEAHIFTLPFCPSPVFHSLRHLILTLFLIHLSPSIKRDLALLRLFLASLLFSVTHSPQPSSFFFLLSFHSHSDRRSFLLKLQSSFALIQSAHHEFVITYNGLFVINSSTFNFPHSSPFFCYGSATGCLVVVIYP